MNTRGILHLAPFLQGGAGRAIADLACAQHELGHQVTVVASSSGDEGYGNYPEYLSQLREAGVTLHLCDSLFKRDLALNLQVLELLRHRVDADALDVIHAHAAVPALVGRLFAGHSRGRIPVVQTQHGWGSSKTPAQAAADLAVLRDVDRVIVTSEATRDLLVGHGVPPWGLTVIPCGVSPRVPGPPPAEALRILRPLRERGAHVIGCIGSVTANKNQQLVVEALRALGGLDIVAVFIGEGSEALMMQAAMAGVSRQVIACGYQPQASKWLPLLDLLVLPSKTEGQGLAVLEAFRAGVPVVASNIPPLAQTVQHQKTGFLFQPDDAAALATVIRAALALPGHEREALTRAARARFSESFTADRMVARHEALYAQVASPAAMAA
jgi:glycosyltransferase involved in cell wall biosynthesis